MLLVRRSNDDLGVCACNRGVLGRIEKAERSAACCAPRAGQRPHRTRLEARVAQPLPSDGCDSTHHLVADARANCLQTASHSALGTALAPWTAASKRRQPHRFQASPNRSGAKAHRAGRLSLFAGESANDLHSASTAAASPWRPRQPCAPLPLGRPRSCQPAMSEAVRSSDEHCNQVYLPPFLYGKHIMKRLC